ncbi:hypothetical protein RCG24_04035 [Neobacillus sp. OS1-32]|uniref:hypothetical protein n=1 Tax=Neobacillus sp. OS1-32 TaxID=3070682 RepID=UPI0027DF57BA|nr:hypothetical protein [Neobacillus sp. OS1-32]WML31070.1 hypothetical protein RCG24_04035 [Neobacillus sp. OS1-32]
MERLTYEQALRLKGEIISFKNKQGQWTIGRVAKVRKDGLEIEELNHSGSDEGYGYGFWGPFWGPSVFVGFGFPLFWW